jgi:hypothetical protein
LAGSGAISFPCHQTNEAKRLVFVQKKTPLTAARNLKLRLTGGLEHDRIKVEAIAVAICEIILSHHQQHLGIVVITKSPKIASNSQILVGVKSVTTPLQQRLLVPKFKRQKALVGI